MLPESVLTSVISICYLNQLVNLREALNHLCADMPSQSPFLVWRPRRFNSVQTEAFQIKCTAVSTFQSWDSLTLSPLKLVTVALQCLRKRKTTMYANSDMSYILMGLLQQRPNVVLSDSAFQAFARLSLANDSNLLLERLICLLPKSLDKDWWSLSDAWNAKLWDIYPKIQICG